MNRLLLLLVLAAAVPLAQPDAQAQAYPNRPIRLVVGFPSGGGTDVVARVLAALVRADTARYAKIIKDAGLKLDLAPAEGIMLFRSIIGGYEGNRR